MKTTSVVFTVSGVYNTNRIFGGYIYNYAEAYKIYLRTIDDPEWADIRIHAYII